MTVQTHPKILTKAFNNIYFAIAFTLLAIIYFFVAIFFGLDFTDTFFHLNQAQNPPLGSRVFPILLSSFLIKGIIDLFGEQLIYLRIINALLFITALLLPFLFIKTRLPKKETILYIGLGIKVIDQPVKSLTFYQKIIAETRSQKRIAIFLISSYPESAHIEENAIETKLIEEGFRKHSKGSLIFLTKAED